MKQYGSAAGVWMPRDDTRDIAVNGGRYQAGIMQLDTSRSMEIEGCSGCTLGWRCLDETVKCAMVGEDEVELIKPRRV